MSNMIVELSKYVMIVLLAFYTLHCFIVFRYANEEERRGFYIGQNIFMFLIHFLGYLVLCFQTGDTSLILFFAVQQIMLFSVIMLYRILYPDSNRLIINNMCMLLCVSFIILTRLSYSRSVKQFKIVLASLILSLVIPYFISHLKFIKKFTWICGHWYFFAGVGYDTWKCDIWFKNLVSIVWIHFSAIRVRENNICVLSCWNACGICRFVSSCRGDADGGRACHYPCAEQRFGERFDFFCGLCCNAVCRDQKTDLPYCRTCIRLYCIGDRLQTFSACADKSDRMAGSFQRDRGAGIPDHAVVIFNRNRGLVWNGTV